MTTSHSNPRGVSIRHELFLRGAARDLGEVAFTLIELLTVIAIIGILAAIIIPTIGKVRQTAYKTACASNLRQIGTAIIAYAADNKDFLPGSERTSENYIGLDGQVGSRWYRKDGRSGSNGLISHLVPYLMSNYPSSGNGVAAFAICPASQRAYQSSPTDPHASYLLSTGVEVSGSNTVRRPFGKTTNSLSNAAFEGNRSLRLSEIASPSNAIAAFDLDCVIWRALGNSNASGVPDQPVHGNTRNFLYIDGHVKSMPLDTKSPKP